MREFYRLLSSLRLSTSTKRSLKSRDSVDFTTATDISAKRSAVPTLLLFVIRLINANSWSPWMVPPHRLSLPKRVRYYYATRRKFLVPEVSFDLTTARLSGEYLPIRSLWQNSLRNTRRSRDIFNQRTSVLIQLFPPTTTFKPLLHRLCLSFVIFR